MDDAWTCERSLTNVEVCTLKCGDGVLQVYNDDTEEECDDGNLIDDDGCTSCVVDSDYACYPTDPLDDTSTSTCDFSCGNSRREESEACDDGNTSDDDGCSALCDEVE